VADEETMQRHTLGFALAFVTIALGVSCGSDSESANNGTGGTGGTGGQDSGPLPGVPCGSTRCLPREGTTEDACCQDEFTSRCGIQSGSSCADVPPEADPRCPSVDLPFVGELISCCTNGDCGIIAPRGFGGGGCTELAEAQRQADEFTGDGGFQFDGGFDAGFQIDGGIRITLPPPQRCDR
jgi:hypothetical protein